MDLINKNREHKFEKLEDVAAFLYTKLQPHNEIASKETREYFEKNDKCHEKLMEALEERKIIAERDSKAIEELQKSITPMIESYKASMKLGKWAMGLLAFISIIIGIFLGFKNLIK